MTNVDSARLFGIVLSGEQAVKRLMFLRAFHAWHRENRVLLKPLVQIQSLDSIVGRPCTVHSVLQSQWSRALVVSVDAVSRCSCVYLVDYCKTVVTNVDRLYM